MKKLLLSISMIFIVLMAYAQSCPDGKHPHAIDLGLPSGTKWACCNVGATTPEGYGGYYAWGEKKMKSVYNEVTYKYCSGTDTNGDGWYYDEDGWLDEIVNYKELGSISGTKYDVAHKKWGGKWQLPSPEQIVELLNNCTSTWITTNGVSGRIFTSSNGNSIFLPATDQNAYWSRELNTALPFYAFGRDFDLQNVKWLRMWSPRIDGCYVRAVQMPQD